jgi:hypothetical protein
VLFAVLTRNYKYVYLSRRASLDHPHGQVSPVYGSFDAGVTAKDFARASMEPRVGRSIVGRLAK